MFYSRTLINLSQNDPGLTGPKKLILSTTNRNNFKSQSDLNMAICFKKLSPQIKIQKQIVVLYFD